MKLISLKKSCKKRNVYIVFVSNFLSDRSALSPTLERRTKKISVSSGRDQGVMDQALHDLQMVDYHRDKVLQHHHHDPDDTDQLGGPSLVGEDSEQHEELVLERVADDEDETILDDLPAVLNSGDFPKKE